MKLDKITVNFSSQKLQARIDEQTKDGKFTEELLSELEKQQKA